MMRNTILKRRMQQGDVQPKGPNRELKRLQLSDDVVGNVPEPPGANGEQRKIMSLCIYCEKSFERRAALSTHLLNCRAKQEALAKPAPAVKKLKSNLNEAQPPPAEAEPGIEEMFADLAEQNENYVPALQTVSLDKLQLQPESDTSSDEASPPSDEEQEELDEHEQEQEQPSTDKVKKKRNVPLEKQLRCCCKICHKQFNALGNLRRHISMFHYRARRFGCTICDYRAFRRYDIVNHLGFTHKIEGDRDSLTEKYVSTHECEYSRDDVDGDILLLDKKQPAEGEAVAPAKTYEKRLKRAKVSSERQTAETAPTSPIAVVVKEEPQEEEPLSSNKKRRKSRTQISPDSTRERSVEKRPIRKRVKAVNKDFVYDMVSFKPDAGGTTGGAQTAAQMAVDSMRAKLRRQPTVSSAAAEAETKPKQWEAFLTEEKKPLVQGITRRIMLELVSQGRAVSATLPELPAERPQIRPRLISYTRSDCGQKYTVDTPSPVSRVGAGESFIEKIAKRTAAAGQKDATISNLWNKVNNAIAQQQKTDEAPEGELEMNVLHRTPNGKQSSSGSSSAQLTPPSPPRKGNAVVLNTSNVMETETTSSPAALAPATATASPTATAPAPAPLPAPATTHAGECLSTCEPPMATGASNMFPSLPKPPSVLQAAANGTIQFTLDSLLRAALQN